jgi:competence ComEA-like helix-hairpin-helix protein
MSDRCVPLGVQTGGSAPHDAETDADMTLLTTLQNRFSRSLAHALAGAACALVLTISPAAAQAAENPLTAIARSHYQVGMQYLRSGLPSRALEEFQKATVADSSFLDAHIQSGYLLARGNRWTEAITYYRRAVQLSSRRADLHLALADAYRGRGDTVSAKQYYASSLALNPDQPSTAMLLAQIHIREGAFAEALKLLEGTSGLTSDMNALTLRAYIAHRMNKLDDAVSLYQRILERDPENAEALLNLGVVEAAQGKLVEAAAHFRRAAPRAADKALAYKYLGLVQYDLGQFREAEESFNRSLGENPGDVVARFKMANAQFRLQRFAESARQLEAIRSSAGAFPELTALLGRALLASGQPERARTELERAVAAAPNDTILISALAETYRKVGENRLAIDHYNRLVALRAADADVYRSLSDLYAVTGDAVKALQYERIFREQSFRAEVQSAVDAERRIWEARFEDLRAQADRRATDAEASAERRVAEQQREIEARVRSLQERSNAAIAVARAEAESRAIEIETISRRQVEELRRRNEQMPADSHPAIVRIRADAEARVAAARRESDELRRELENLRRSGMPATIAAIPISPTVRTTGGDTETVRMLIETRKALEAAEMRATMAEAANRRLRASAGLDTGAARTEFNALRAEVDAAKQEAAAARAKMVELTASLEKERATREEALAQAERIRAQSQLLARESRNVTEELAAEVERGLGEIRADTTPAAGTSTLDRLKFYVQNVRLAADARVARAQLQAEARLNEFRVRSESEVTQILRDAKAQIDRARAQAAEEVRRLQIASDSEVERRILQERERLSAEALAKRLALAEELRAKIEADAQIRFLEDKAQIEATYEADRIRMQRDYDVQLEKFQSEYQRRLEAAQLEARRATEQVEALTRNDTALLMRSEVYQRLVRENAVVREDLAGARRRLETLGREKEELLREADSLRRDFANVQARIGALEEETRRYAGIEVLAEPLQRGVNINSATIEQLQALPGIGVQEARNIIWYRENVGPFRGVEELVKVPGMEATKAAAIRGLIKVR